MMMMIRHEMYLNERIKKIVKRKKGNSCLIRYFCWIFILIQCSLCDPCCCGVKKKTMKDERPNKLQMIMIIKKTMTMTTLFKEYIKSGF